MTDALRLDQLPSDILILIFDYCHAFDLVRLSEVCVRFNDLISCDTLWIRKSKLPLVTNQTSTKFRARCNSLLCLRKKWQISYNWQDGKYQKEALMHHNKIIPWIQMSDNLLWWGGGRKLCAFPRRDPDNSEMVFYFDKMSSDIYKFVIRDDKIISGHRDGSIQFWSAEGMYKIRSIPNAHTHAVHAVEETDGVLIGGSALGILRIWDEMINIPYTTIDLQDRIWSIAGNENQQKFAVGCAGRNTDNNSPLRLFDLETCEELYILRHEFCRGAGILDMVWDNPYTLLTVGYDTCIRKWDTRAGKCVARWVDPTGAITYCLSTDYQYTMVTGTQFNGKAVLWDQRKTDYVQLYFMNLDRLSSPVYSISFDNCHLYGATDQLLVDLDFSGKFNKCTNYRNILNYDWSEERQNNFFRRNVYNYYKKVDTNSTYF